MLGNKYGRLTVIRYYGKNKNGNSLWICECDCGNITNPIVNSSLTSGRTKSCGCLEKENLNKIHEELKKYNKYEYVGDIVKVYLENEHEFFLCDKTIWTMDEVRRICWVKNSRNYIIGRNPNTGKNVLFHRFIYDFENVNNIIDHINGNTLDNRLCNLRETKQMCNTWNRIVKNSSRIHGIEETESGKWYSHISVNGNRINLGTYENIEDAISARMDAEKLYFGEYSVINSRKDCTSIISLDEILKANEV